jgi:hypothetical protein
MSIFQGTKTYRSNALIEFIKNTDITQKKMNCENNHNNRKNAII